MRDLKPIISRSEYLGVDTQPLRTLQAFVVSKKVDPSDYDHLIHTLELQLRKPYAANSNPMQIRMILTQLAKKLDNVVEASVVDSQAAILGGVQELVKSAIAESAVSSKDVLGAIKLLSDEIKTLKAAESTVHIRTSALDSQIETPRVEGIGPVFVNPLDTKAADSIKANVDLESKQGNNIKDKLDRLKRLKNK